MRIDELQTTRNAATCDAWQTFAGHRARVMELLRSTAPPEAQSLCVLGAGNCNDLDLKELLELYPEIQLVDLDADAMSAGIERQAIAAQRVRLVSSFDVTGVARQLSAWEPAAPASNVDIDAVLPATSQVPQLPNTPFDAALSGCLLSQLIDGIGHTLGEQHPQFLEVLSAIRLQHLRLLLDVVRPGGVAVLMTDIVSSDTCPAILQAEECDLSAVLSEAINARNFFTGLNPIVLLQLFSTDDYLARSVSNIRMARPWLWNLGPRSYAVCAIVIRRR